MERRLDLRLTIYKDPVKEEVVHEGARFQFPECLEKERKTSQSTSRYDYVSQSRLQSEDTIQRRGFGVNGLESYQKIVFSLNN